MAGAAAVLVWSAAAGAAAPDEPWAFAEAETGIEASPSAGERSSPLSAPLAGWLEQAARTYQSEIAEKLTVPRQSAEAESTFLARLREAVAGALRYVSFWMARAYVAAGLSPPTPSAFVARPAPDIARPAPSSEPAAKDSGQKGTKVAEAVDTEAEKRRAEERKAELEKLKKDLDREISEGMKRLEQFQKDKAVMGEEAARKKALAEEAARQAEEKRKAEEERAKAEEEQKRKADEARKAGEARKAAAAKRLLEAQADYTRSVAAAEAARKVAEDWTAQEEKRAAAEEEEERQAAAREEAREAEEKRRAEAEAAKARKAATEAARAAEEKRIAEARADYARRVAAAEEARKAREASEPQPAGKPETAKGEAANEAAAEPAPRRSAEPESEARPHRAHSTRIRNAKRELRRTHAHARCKRTRRDRRYHVVEPGETLWDISRRYLRKGERYGAIVRANRRTLGDPDLIYPCQRLRLPRRHR